MIDSSASSYSRQHTLRRSRWRAEFAVLAAVAALLTSLVGIAINAGPASAAGVVRGSDVSSHQSTVNWTAAYAHGARFAYVKATEGRTTRAPRSPSSTGARTAWA